MSMAEQLPLADVKNRLSEVVERVEREHGRVVITKHGRPAAVVLSVEDLESLEETLEILSDPTLLAEIREAERERSKGLTKKLSKNDVAGSNPPAVTADDDAYDVEWASAALRAIDRLPEKVATAVIEFVYTSLATSPHRVGRPLRFELEGLYSARRGDYRIVYRIDDDHATIVIDTIAHRSDIYRRR